MNGGLWLPLIPSITSIEKSASCPSPPTPYDRWKKGWVSFTTLTSDQRFDADYNLKDPEIFKSEDSSDPSRYFLIECRHAHGTMAIGQTTTGDYNHFAPWNLWGTRPGLQDVWLMVYAIKKNTTSTLYARLIQADGFNNSSTGNQNMNMVFGYLHVTHWGDSGDIFPGLYDVRVLSPWSFPLSLEGLHTPSTRPTTNVGFEIVSVQNDYITVDFYADDPEDASPAQPRFLEVAPSANNHPYLTWYLNDNEPDRTAYEIYKKKNSPNFTLYATVSGNQNYYEDTNEIMLTGPPQANESMVYYRLKAVDSQGKRSTFSNEVNSRIPGSPQEKIASNSTGSDPLSGDYALLANYPNPFNPVTHIRFRLPEDSRVRIQIYNITGEFIVTLTDQAYSAGDHEISFDAKDLSSGIYVYRMETGGYSQVRKMMVLK